MENDCKLMYLQSGANNFFLMLEVNLIIKNEKVLQPYGFANNFFP
jgi:hypothetical protein